MSIQKIIREALENRGCESCRYEHNLTRCEYCQFYYTTTQYKPTEERIKEIMKKIEEEQCLKKDTTSENTITRGEKDTNS